MDDTELTGLRQAVQEAPEELERRLALLKALVTHERWQEADEVSGPLLQEDPVRGNVHGLLALTYGKLERWDEAIQQSQKALDLQPDDTLLLFNLGTALGNMDEIEAAHRAFEKAAEQQADWAELQFNLGAIRLRLEAYSEALDAFERAAELREAYAEAYFSCGNVHAMKALDASGKLDYYEMDRAITAYKRAVHHRPGYTAALYNLGMLYGHMKSDEGLRMWDQYLEAAGELDDEQTFCMRARQYKENLQERLR